MSNEENTPEEILATLAPDEQEWTSFLEERPKTKKFYRSLVLGSIIILQLQRGGKTIHYEDYKPIDVLDSTGDLFPPLEMLYSQVMTGHILSGHHTLPTNLGDEETLAESVLRFDAINFYQKILENPVYPRINSVKAASYIAGNTYLLHLNKTNYSSPERLYFRLLCTCSEKYHDVDPKTAWGFADRCQDIFNNADQFTPYAKWDTLDTFIDTVMKYGHATMLGHLGVGVIIDEDYLNNTLLSSRPDPIDIADSAWHDMSVEFVRGLDEELAMATAASRYDCDFFFSSLAMKSLSRFLSDKSEELSFLETVYDYLLPFSVDEQYGNVHYVRGMIRPEVFDYLREYGPSFITPLVEAALVE